MICSSCEPLGHATVVSRDRYDEAVIDVRSAPLGADACEKVNLIAVGCGGQRGRLEARAGNWLAGDRADHPAGQRPWRLWRLSGGRGRWLGRRFRRFSARERHQRHEHDAVAFHRYPEKHPS